MIELVLVAAVGENRVIGRGNALPWRLKSDMRHFRALTTGKPVLMGRRTFLSIGKPLPGRTNVVVSLSGFAAPGIVVAGGLEAGLAVARADALRRGVGEIIVLGGAEIYASLMPRADRLELTLVHASPTGDALFPEVDPAVWRETARTRAPQGPDDTAPFSFVSYRRVAAASCGSSRAPGLAPNLP